MSGIGVRCCSRDAEADAVLVVVEAVVVLAVAGSRRVGDDSTDDGMMSVSAAASH